MKHGFNNPEVHSYLHAVETRLAHLPADQSEEILFGMREHITEALARGGQSAQEVLRSLGSPDDVVAGLAIPGVAVPRMTQATPRPAYQSSTLWVVAVTILLPFGVLLAGIGWLFGVAGLWMGTRWKVWEKIMGTVIFPGGFLGGMIIARLPLWGAPSPGPTVEPIIPGLPLAATAAMTCLPIAVAVYLLVAGLRRGPRPA